MLTNFGGIFAIVKSFFGAISNFINSKVVKAKFMRSLFFYSKPEQNCPKFKIKLGDSYMSTKIARFRTLKLRFYNFFRETPND